jgi:DNA-binding NtrC family response regulator
VHLIRYDLVFGHAPNIARGPTQSHLPLSGSAAARTGRESRSISTAQHFNAALDILDQSPPPEVLITDIVIPKGVNGAALARMARMRSRRIRVIYITGYDIPNLDRETFGPMLREPPSDDLLLATVATELSANDTASASARTPTTVAPRNSIANRSRDCERNEQRLQHVARYIRLLLMTIGGQLGHECHLAINTRLPFAHVPLGHL